MSNDKKTCENCGNKNKIAACHTYRRDSVYPGCEYWTRNPRKWLDILPTEPGWYWFKNNLRAKKYEVIFIFQENRNERLICQDLEGNTFILGVNIGGCFQGPITPEE